MKARYRREVGEWIGATPDTGIPPRVKERVVAAQANRCAHCGNEFSPHLLPEFDHVTACINDGENREGNIQALCDLCHSAKTADDVALKAKVARKRAKHLGLYERPKMPVGGWAALKFMKMPDGRIVDRATGETVGRRR